MSSYLDDKELVTLNQLFADLHDNDDYQQAFTKFLKQLKQLVYFQKGDVYFYKKDGDHIAFEDFIFVDWSDDFLDKYINDYADIDDVLPIISMKQPVMFRSSDVFLVDERMKTRYYNELLLPAGMEYSIEGNIYMGDDGYMAGIGIHRPGESGDFTQKELEIMKLARPHLVTVARKFINTKSNISQYALSLAALYNFDEIGICVFDNSYNLTDSNLEKINLIKKECTGEVYRSLITLCKNLGTRIKSYGLASVLEDNKVQSRVIIDDKNYYIEVACRPLGNDDYKFVSTIYDSGTIFENMFKEIRDRYKLTEREFEILKYAMKGVSNDQISRELFISVPTVKKHLTAVYQKLGIEGKHQILGLVIG